MKSHNCTDTIYLSSQPLPASSVSAAGKGHWLDRLWNAPGVVSTFIGNCFYIWQERSEQRLALRDLDDRMLADIGLSRTEAEREGSKPFWTV